MASTKKTHRPWAEIKAAKNIPEDRARANREWVRKRVLDLNLAALRKHAGFTQAELARLAKMSQSELSRAEARDDHLVSTIRRLVNAMGGEVRVSAVFKDVEVRLYDV